MSQPTSKGENKVSKFIPCRMTTHSFKYVLPSLRSIALSFGSIKHVPFEGVHGMPIYYSSQFSNQLAMMIASDTHSLSNDRTLTPFSPAELVQRHSIINNNNNVKHMQPENDACHVCVAHLTLKLKFLGAAIGKDENKQKKQSLSYDHTFI